MKYFITVIVIIVLYVIYVFSPKAQPMTINSQAISYLPLGDSYTIGEGLPETDRWPNQLASHLNRDGIEVIIVANPARTGFTTQQLIDYELPLVQQYKPQVVTLQIGVNDWVQGVSKEDFQANIKLILDNLQNTLADRNAIVIVTIPDFSASPTGAQYGSGRDISAGIAEFNAVLLDEATARGLPIADVYPVSQQMKVDPSLIHTDGLHPSAKQYALWEAIIYPKILPILNKP
ncbi:MAG: SGNH/GDSL hydrolase family protein [Weeksellaceae bacterium]